MDPNTVVLEISSDEDNGWNDHDGSGIAYDGGDDHTWLSDLLDEVNKETSFGDDSDDVVLVGEVSPSEKSKKKSKLKSCLINLDDDCVILDNDPDKPVEVRNDDRSNVDDDSDDILVVSEKGQVACRDYPHSRHLCIKYPFSTTPKQSHCEQCYCYVCDSLAPCIYWGNGTSSTNHCFATDKDEFWKLERKRAKPPPIKSTPKPSPPPVHRPSPPPLHPPPPNTYIPSRPNRSTTNFQPQTPNIINQHRSLFASRHKFHQNLVSQHLRIANNHNLNNHNLNSNLIKPVFKRTSSSATSRYTGRGNIVNSTGQQNYNLNMMVSGTNRLQSNSVNPSVQFTPLSQTQSQGQSQNQNQSTMNPIQSQSQPQLPSLLNSSFQSQVNSNQSQGQSQSIQSTINPVQSQLQPQFSNLQSQVNSNPFQENLFQQPNLVPSYSRTQVGPGQPRFPLTGQTQVNIPQIPVSDFTQNFTLEGNQVENSTKDQTLQDYGINWPPGEDSVALNESASLVAAVSGGGTSLADYRYDWMFENQPVEPGLMDINGPYGSGDFSTDSCYLDTGPIFDF